METRCEHLDAVALGLKYVHQEKTVCALHRLASPVVAQSFWREGVSMSELNVFSLAANNLFSPPVLAFVLGLIAVSVKSDLRLPEAFYQAISIYLLLGIGIKGGVALRNAELADIWLPLLVTLALGLTIPVAAFYLSGVVTKLDAVNRGALAAHYGSTSLVTFTAAMVFVETSGQFVEGFLVTLLAVLEIPGIIVGLLLASRGRKNAIAWGESLREVLAGRSIVLLVGGLALGAITGSRGFASIEPFFAGLFTGVLTLFLLELGIVAGRRLKDIRAAGAGVVVFGLTFPLLAGFFGVAGGLLSGLSVGGAALLGVLSASASYIAAPTAVRLALPEASPGIYLTASLGITFPFNLIVGIPVYYWLSQSLEGVLSWNS